MFEDPLFWVFVLPGLLLGLYAQSRIKLNVTKYSQVRTQDGITGAEVARQLLDAQGLHNVAIESTPGVLSDHYDPRSKTLRLSQQVYFAPSVAAAGIAAHEAGHALQDAEDYFPMEARTYMVPVVQLASQIAPWLFVSGLVLQLETLTWVGVILFGASFLLAFLTLPVEFNASARAKELLVRHRIIQGDEQLAGVEKVLGAAAWTYVAAAVSATSGTLPASVCARTGLEPPSSEANIAENTKAPPPQRRFRRSKGFSLASDDITATTPRTKPTTASRCYQVSF